MDAGTSFGYGFLLRMYWIVIIVSIIIVIMIIVILVIMVLVGCDRGGRVIVISVYCIGVNGRSC